MTKAIHNGVCGICGKTIKYSGFAMVAHLRKHVRNGELVEKRGPVFKPPNDPDGAFSKAGAYF